VDKPVSDLSYSVDEPGREMIAGKRAGDEIEESLFPAVFSRTPAVISSMALADIPSISMTYQHPW
jgi:hypothetical protein